MSDLQDQLLLRYLHDIRVASERKHPIMIPNPFSFHDFKVDQQCNLVYKPARYSTMCLDFFALAAHKNHANILEALLVFSSLHQPCDPTTLSPLCLSLLNKSHSVTKFLLSKGVHPCGESCTNGLHAAARVGDKDLIKDFVLDKGIPPNCTDAFGFTPVIYALYLPEKKAIDTVSFLFSLKALPTYTICLTSVEYTYAYFAAAMNKPGLANWLEQTAKQKLTYTIEYIQKQTQQLCIEEDADWDIV